MTRLFITLLAVATLAGCGKRETPVEWGNKQQVLLIGNAAEPKELDPHVTTGVAEARIELALFEGLTSYHPKTLEPQPGVAESWEISEDGRVYTFKLRPDAQWSNGDTVTAEDFVFSINRILTPDLGAEYASIVYSINNAEAYNLGIGKDFSEVGVQALDAQTLEITLENPTPYFLTLTSFLAFYPVHKETILKHGGMSERGTGWTRPENMVSNGPFKLKSWVVGDRIEVERNPYYHGAQSVRLNGIRFFPIENVNTEERAFRAGQLHITDNFPGDKLESYREQKSPDLQINPYLGTEYYWFNTTRPPFNDVRVRNAFSRAINRKQLVTHVEKRGQLPAYSLVPPDTAGYTSDNQLKESVSSAQRLLAEAGYPNGEGFPKVELIFNTTVNRRKTAEAVQKMWKDNLNVEVSLINQEWKHFLTTRAGKHYDICRGGWIGDYPDPYAFLELFESISTNNHSGWSNGSYDLILEESRKSIDQKKRYAYMQEAEAIAVEEMPVIPLFYFNSASLIKKSVHGWHPNLLNMHPYQYVWLEEVES